MKTIKSGLILCTLLGAMHVHAQVNLPTPGQPGSTPNNAVKIISTSELMVDRDIERWLRRNCKGCSWTRPEYQEIGDTRYAVVDVTSQNDQQRRMYFRISSRQIDQGDDDFGF